VVDVLIKYGVEVRAVEVVSLIAFLVVCTGVL